MEAPFLIITLLLGVELTLLVISIILLLMSRREHSGRSKLLEALLRATRELTRYEYFLAVVESIMDAGKRIDGIATGRKPTTPTGREMLDRILDAIKDASRRGVKARYILYPSPDRIGVAYRYAKAGAEVRMHPYAGLADSRYMLVDDSLIVIGLAGKESSHPTRTGFVIRSLSLNQILSKHFEQLWMQAEPFESYAAKVVEDYLKTHGELNIEAVAKTLGVSKDFLERLKRMV